MPLSAAAAGIGGLPYPRDPIISVDLNENPCAIGIGPDQPGSNVCDLHPDLRFPVMLHRTDGAYPTLEFRCPESAWPEFSPAGLSSLHVKQIHAR